MQQQGSEAASQSAGGRQPDASSMGAVKQSIPAAASPTVAKPLPPPKTTSPGQTVGGVLQNHTEAPKVDPTVVKPAAGSEIGWTLTALGIIASLAFNIFNYLRVSGLQKRIRRETVKVEEFRRVRTPLDASLAEFRSQRDVFRGYADSGLATKELRTQSLAAQKSLTEAFNAFAGALQDADESKFANGGDWFQPVSALWDELVIRFDVIQNPKRTEPETRRAISEIADRIERMRRVTFARIDEEMKQYTLGA